MKHLILASLMLGSVTVANAGAINFIPPQVAAIEEPARMGGSGAWIVPLVIVGVIVLATTSSSDTNCKVKSGNVGLSIQSPC